MKPPPTSLAASPRPPRWLNRTVLGIGLASLFSDWSHETATAVLPAFLGVAAAWLGLIEGVADGVSSFAKMASGFYIDRLLRRKPIAVAGYIVTALGTAAFGLATSAWHVLAARTFAWFGRGVRTPVRKALQCPRAIEGRWRERGTPFSKLFESTTQGARSDTHPTATMRAARIHSYGDPTGVKISQAPRPEPGRGQVLIRVKAAGVNPLDWMVAEGKARSPLFHHLFVFGQLTHITLEL